MNKKYRSGTTNPTGKSAKITTGAPSNDIPYHSTQQAAYRQIHRNIIPLIKKRYQVYIVIKNDNSTDNCQTANYYQITAAAALRRIKSQQQCTANHKIKQNRARTIPNLRP